MVMPIPSFSARPPVDELAALWQSLIVRQGYTTAPGAGTGQSIIDAGLIGVGLNSYLNMPIIIYVGDPNRLDSATITAFNNGTGEVTFDKAYKGVAAALPAGVPYAILTLSHVSSAIVAAILAIVTAINANVGLEGATSLADKLTLARALLLDNLATLMSFQGLVYHGAVTNVPGANQFDIGEFIGLGFGDTYFENYFAYVVQEAGGAAPHGEFARVSAYVDATARFTHDAGVLSAAIGNGDRILLVHPSLIDDLYGSGMVHFDSLHGIAGTMFPIGGTTVPSNTEADTRTICLRTSLRKISIYGAFTVPAIMEGYEFIGHGQYSGLDTIDLNGQDVDSCVFRRLNLIGAQGGTTFIVLEDCNLVGATNIMGTFYRTLIQTATLRNGVTDMIDCAGWQGAATITVDIPNPLNLFRWSGDLNLDGQTGGITNIFASGGGLITIMPSCVGGTVNIYGDARVVDTSGVGCTVNDYTITSRTANLAGGENVATHVHANNVNWQTVVTIDPLGLRRKVHSIWMNFVNLTQNTIYQLSYNYGGLGVYEVFDSNAAAPWTPAMDNGVLIECRNLVIGHELRLEIQSQVLEGAPRDVPYEAYWEPME